MSRRLTDKELQREAEKIMDGVSDADSSEDIPEPYSDSGSSYRPSESSNSDFSDEESEVSETNEIDNNQIEETNQNEETIDAETVEDEWVDVDCDPDIFDFLEPEGLKRNVSSTSTPLEIFEMLFDVPLLEKIVDWVNLRAKSIKDKNVSLHSNMKNWKDTNCDEIRRFLGLCLIMGNISMPTIKNYWAQNSIYNHPIFSKTMPRNRFEAILRCLCFYKNEDDKSSRLYKVDQVVEHIMQNIRAIYYPGQNLSLDEALLLWRGRLLFRQYIPNKSAKYGIKIYELCTPDGFVLDILIYTGRGTVNNETGHAQSVVTHLTKRILGKGHILYLDNYYNSVKLANFLYENKTHVVGTLRKSRKENPKVVVNAKLRKGQTIFRRKGKVLVMKWKDKREVLMISTAHSAKCTTHVSKRGTQCEKPVAVIDYNKFMSGVDRCDQMVSYYTTPRKTIRWYLKVFFHMLDICLWNSTYIYNLKHQKKISYLKFRDMVISSLLLPIPENVPRNRSINRSVSHYPKKIEKRIRCQICSSKKIRSQTFYICDVCKDNKGKVIGLCVDPCFKEYHEKST